MKYARRDVRLTLPWQADRAAPCSPSSAASILNRHFGLLRHKTMSALGKAKPTNSPPQTRKGRMASATALSVLIAATLGVLSAVV